MNDAQKLTKDWVVQKLPKRPKDANKGTFGKVLVVAGSENFPGAAYLACSAAYRVGAGLVTLVTEPTVKTIISKQLPEVTFLPRDEVLESVNKYDVLLIGPGLRQDYQLPDANLPLAVIDAGGLKWGIRLKGDAVLTPHPGEMSRITGLTIAKIQSDRVNIAQYFAKKWGKVVVLKGANTVIAQPKGEVAISPFVNPALSTAGTGDVLAGIIAGMMAQGLTTFDAACVGVYLHGLAGKTLQNRLGNAGAIASDLLSLLPKVLKSLH